MQTVDNLIMADADPWPVYIHQSFNLRGRIDAVTVMFMVEVNRPTSDVNLFSLCNPAEIHSDSRCKGADVQLCADKMLV
jgi:hypothetical protein